MRAAWRAAWHSCRQSRSPNGVDRLETSTAIALGSALIALAALGLSGFSLYFTALSKRRSLFLVRVDETGEFDPRFVLVNGGKVDLIITQLGCFFVNKSKGSRFHPAQRLASGPSESFLLEAGKAFDCTMSFLEPFTPAFASSGEVDHAAGPAMYWHDMQVGISWIEPSGRERSAQPVIVSYGFADSGEIRGKRPIGKSYDLYESRTLRSLLPW